MIIRELSTGRRIATRNGIGPTLGRKLEDGPPYEVWGKLYNARKERWSSKNNLHYVNEYEIEARRNKEDE